MIKFNVPPYIGTELHYIEKVIKNRKLSGDGEMTKECSRWLESNLGAGQVLLTTSCSHALEMAALLIGIKPGDEVIMPSFTFVSTANAFVLRGAKIIFVDIRPDTMNIDEAKIEEAITKKTKAIVPVHYAGVGCEMDKICDLAETYHIKVVEDAAQAVCATYKGRYLGTIGELGCYSFHETKNFSMGEGGALAIRDKEYQDAAEIIREKGTNRKQFLNGLVDKYTWVDMGSSYLPSELNAAYLYGQLCSAKEILEKRKEIWEYYQEGLEPLEAKGRIKRPVIPEGCEHNAHIYYIKVKDIDERTALMRYMKEKGVSVAFHYVPLHNSPAGKRFGVFGGGATGLLRKKVIGWSGFRYTMVWRRRRRGM